MRRESHVRFCEGAGVKFPRATRRNIYVRSQAAGERVMATVTRFLEEKLRLRVNRDKSAVAHVSERKFLGHRLLNGGRLGVAPESIRRAKERIRQITRRNRGVSLVRIIAELNEFQTGWVTYYRYAECRGTLRALDEWVRRKLRCVRLKQRKRAKPIADLLCSLGLPEWTGNSTCRQSGLFHLTRSYNTLVSNQTRAKNRLKSLLRTQAIKARGTTPFAKTPREKMLARLTASGVRERAEMLLREITMLEECIKDAKRAMTREANRHPASAILKSIPGIGDVRAAQLIAAIRTPWRFRRNRHLWGYGGLAVVMRGSSETDYVDGVARKRPQALQTRGLNRNFSRPVKNALKGVATNASRTGELVPYYEALIARGLKPELALVTLARKIATLTLVLWKKGERFDVTKSTSRSI